MPLIRRSRPMFRPAPEVVPVPVAAGRWLIDDVGPPEREVGAGHQAGLVAGLAQQALPLEAEVGRACGRPPRRSCSRCRPARGGCRAGRSALRTWRYSGSGAVMTSELVAGSAWMKPPVDGWADGCHRRGLAAAAAGSACRLLAAGKLQWQPPPPPPAPPPAAAGAAQVAARKGRRSTWRQLGGVGVLQVHHPHATRPGRPRCRAVEPRHRAQLPPGGRVGGAHDQRVAARVGHHRDGRRPPAMAGTAGAAAAFQRCTICARSLATACCSGITSTSVAAGWSSAAMILAMRCRLSA
jgi:hypothetical protein